MSHGPPHCLHAQICVNLNRRPVLGDWCGAQGLQSLKWFTKHMVMSGTELFFNLFFIANHLHPSSQVSCCWYLKWVVQHFKNKRDSSPQSQNYIFFPRPVVLFIHLDFFGASRIGCRDVCLLSNTMTLNWTRLVVLKVPKNIFYITTLRSLFRNHDAIIPRPSFYRATPIQPSHNAS